MQSGRSIGKFKLTTERMVSECGVTFAHASRDLDMHGNNAHKQVRKIPANSRHTFPGHRNMEPEPMRIDHLWHELAELKVEHDISKKPLPTSRIPDVQFRLIVTRRATFNG